jgi:hypothetical protein
MEHARRKLHTLMAGEAPLADLVIRQRISRQPVEYTTHTVTAQAARDLVEAGVTLSPGASVHFILVPGPEKARAWELVQAPIPYDRPAYAELLLRAIESLMSPVGVNRSTLELWLRGNAGYWGPPGTLPPRPSDADTPLLVRPQTPPGRGYRPGAKTRPATAASLSTHI